MDIYFLSSNKYKIKEVKNILTINNVNIIPISKKINEIQSDNIEDIVIDKVIKAFHEIRRPIIVEQTGLLIKDFGNLPGGLTQIFWDALQADKFCKYFSNNGHSKCTAKTIIGFCDGKQIKTFEGKIQGVITHKPKGNRDFQWDCVFQPEGYTKTFSEMGIKEKNKISMRKIALDNLKKYLEERIHD